MVSPFSLFSSACLFSLFCSTEESILPLTELGSSCCLLFCCSSCCTSGSVDSVTDLSELDDFLSSGGSSKRKQCLAANCSPETAFKELRTEAVATLASTNFTRKAANAITGLPASANERRSPGEGKEPIATNASLRALSAMFSPYSCSAFESFTSSGFKASTDEDAG
nr:hypothetical protein Iba_chr05eCG12430 [Ipomoea batatas]GMD90479.1 hypothetical protein Iba_chr14dCG10060 [Ipomoea batatas]GME01113.1 hypothetical protein Iba_scaffold1676643CG0010 [Ipomoea batatas]